MNIDAAAHGDAVIRLLRTEQRVHAGHAILPLFIAMADLFAMAIDLFSLDDIGAILVGLVVVAALIFGVSMSAEDPSGFSGFLRHKRTKTDEARRKRH